MSDKICNIFSQKKGGGGVVNGRFGNFPKIYPFWTRQASEKELSCSEEASLTLLTGSSPLILGKPQYGAEFIS